MKLSMLLWVASVLPQHLADQTCLATTVYLEARSESTIGQYAVAEVAMRRRDRSNDGTSVCDVVSAPRQFAISTTPKTFEVTDLTAWQKAWKIAGDSIDNWNLPKIAFDCLGRCIEKPKQFCQPQRTLDDAAHAIL